MSCKFIYKDKKYSEAELIKVLSNDPAVMAEYGVQMERPQSGYQKEDVSIFNQKIAALKESMNVEVIIDNSVESSRVLAKGDSRTKQAGRPVILINPDKIFKTTAIHEFGHVFIDSLPGGSNNPRFQKALKSLQGTPLEEELRELYPDLNEEMFAKELVTTAIGREGADIWDNESERSKFMSFINWIQDYLRRTFGLDGDTVTSLTRDLLSSKVKKNDLTTGLSMTDQEQRENNNDKESESTASDESAIKSDIARLDKTYKEIRIRVNNIYNEYLPKTPEEREKESLSQEKGTTRFESVKILKEALKEYDKADQKLGVAKYIEWVQKELNEVNYFYDLRKKNNTLTNKKIKASIEWNEGFSMIDDIQQLVISLKDDNTVTEAEQRFYSKILRNLQGKRSELEKKLLQSAREKYAEFMADNDNETRNKYINKFRSEYKAKDIADSGKGEEEYILEQLMAHKDIIRQEAYDEAIAKANTSVSDISIFASNMLSEKNAKSSDIQVLSRMVDAVERTIADYAMSQAHEFDKHNKEHKENQSNDINMKKKYEKFLYTSESGQSYFQSQYKAEYLEKRNELLGRTITNDKAKEAYGDVKVSDQFEYTIDGVTKTIEIEGAHDFRMATNDDGDSSEMSYERLGERVFVNIEDAIAKSEYESWLEDNTEFVTNTDKRVPKQKWKNDKYPTNAKDLMDLNWFKTKLREADELTKNNNSLITRSVGQEWIRLPGILKTDTQRLAEGNYGNLASHKLNEIYSTQADDFETSEGTQREKGEAIRVFADIANKERLRVPIPFRNRLNEKNQSFDLHTIVLMNTVAAKNYAEKKEVEETFLIVLEVMKSRKVPLTGALGKKKIHANDIDGEESRLYKDHRDGLPNDAKKAMDILENRIYGIKNKDAGTIKVGDKDVSLQQLTKSWLKYSGTVALLGNWVNSIVNVSMGSINNIIEAVGGEHYTMKDWGKAGKTYWKDIRKITDDMGSNVDTSRTNRLMEAFNVMGDKQFLDNGFEEKTRAQALMKMNTLRPVAKMGEHMMQAKVMYAIMHNIKAMNSDGKWIDGKGNVVASKKQAADLNEMITFVPNKATGGVEMVLDPKVGSTSFTLQGGRDQILLETRNLIKDRIFELHGNYDPDIQAAMQREFWGKLGWFLRKWVEGGAMRRWRGGLAGRQGMLTKHEDMKDADRFYSQDTKTYKEGYYVTGIRFLTRTIAPALFQLNLSLVKQGSKELSAHEAANLRRVITEVGAILLILGAAGLLDDDDDDTLLLRYTLRRMESELRFFQSPGEAMKIMSTPTASIGTVKRLIMVAHQLADPNAVYEQGDNKGRRKLTVKALKAFPITSQTEKSYEDSLKFLEQMSFQ